MNNGDKIILDLCAGTGAWSKPYKIAKNQYGEDIYDVRIITLPDNDVRLYVPPDNIYGILAAPPCTEFSIAKNSKLKRHFDVGMNVVNACIEIIESCNPVFWALENPVGKLSQFIGKPYYSFQPWWFGDMWTKRTMIWGHHNIPIRTHFNYIPLPGGYIRPGRKTVSIAFNHLMKHGNYFKQLAPFLEECYKIKGRQKDSAFRSITPPGFAQAFFEANQ